MTRASTRAQSQEPVVQESSLESRSAARGSAVVPRRGHSQINRERSESEELVYPTAEDLEQASPDELCHDRLFFIIIFLFFSFTLLFSCLSNLLSARLFIILFVHDDTFIEFNLT